MITFVKTRHTYQSYTDFWRLVELSNFPTIYVDELNVKNDGIFIVSPMNGEWRPHLDNQKGRRNAHLIFWNLERPSSAGSVRQYGKDNWELIHNRYVDEVWVSDAKLADETGCRFIKMGSHPDLGSVSEMDKRDLDFIHLSYVVPRRQAIYSHFSNLAPNAWPPERNEYLTRSRFAVNVHQDQFPFQEPLRFSLFAAYGIPIISEAIVNPFPWRKDTIELFNYADLVPALSQILQDPYQDYYEMGLRGRELLCQKYTFSEMVEEGIHESTRGGWR